MERYNLRSGSLATTVVSSSSEIQDSGRTEESHLADFAVRDAARLAAEGIAPNLMEFAEILSPPKPLRQRPFRVKKSASRLNRPESGAKLWCVFFSFRH